MILDANKFTRTGEGALVTELSDLAIGRQVPPPEFTLVNCLQEGQHRHFKLVATDRSGGDIAGWRYDEWEGPNNRLVRVTRPHGGWVLENHGIKVVIIND